MIQAQESVERPYGWVVVAASLLMMTIGAGGYYVVIVGLKLVAQEFGGVRSVPSMAYSMAILGMGLGGIFIGRWSDRVGVGIPALAGALMVVAGTSLASVATHRWAFLLAHGVLIGLLGNAALFSPLIANAAHWFDRRRGIAVSIVASAQGLAGIVWPSTFQSLIEATSWRQAYQTYAWFALVTMVPLSLALMPRAPVTPGPGSSERRPSEGLVLGFAGNGVLALLCLAIAGCCVAMAMPIVHVVAYATDLEHTLSQAASVLAVLLACAFVSRIAWGFVGDRIGGLRVLMICSAFQAVVLGMYLFVESLPGLLVVSGLFGLAFGGIIPSYTLIISKHFPPGSIGWRIATVYFFGAIGMAVGGWLGGFIFDLSGGYREAFAAGLFFNFANLLIVGALLIREAPSFRTVNI